MMNWGCGAGGAGMFCAVHLLRWVLIIVGAATFVRWLLSVSCAKDESAEDRALVILRERFTRSDIDKTEFDTRRRDMT